MERNPKGGTPNRVENLKNSVSLVFGPAARAYDRFMRREVGPGAPTNFNDDSGSHGGGAARGGGGGQSDKKYSSSSKGR